MSPDIYCPRAGTLSARVLAWFFKNPEEELSSTDLALKFDISDPSNIRHQLSSAIAAELLIFEKVKQQNVYRIGPNLTLRNIDQAKTELTAHNVFASRTKRPADAIELPDLATLPLEKDVPLPRRYGGAKIDWEPLLSRMEPGHSTVLPLRCRSGLTSTLRLRAAERGGEFSIRKVSASEIRLFRKA